MINIGILISWYGLASQVVILVLSLFIKRRYFSPISDIPGPFAASFTRLWHVKRVIVGDQNVQILGLHRKHGQYVRISHDEVSISHPDVVKQILINPLRKAPWYKLLAFPDWRFQTPLSTLDPKAKNERSRWLASGYLTKNLLQSEDAIDRQIEKLKEWLDRYAQSGAPMDLDKFFTYCAFDVVGEVMFSRPFGYIEQGVDIAGSIASSVTLNMMVAWGGWYRWLFDLFLTNPLVTWLDVMPMGHLAKIAQGALRARRDSPDVRFDVVEHWLRNHREHPDQISFRDIQAVTATNVGAGSDTISTAIQSFVYYMIRDPESWSRARSEIREAQGREGSCRDRVISFADAQKLPFLQARIKEAIRVFPPVPMGLMREAPPEGIKIGDRTFPAGVLLSVSPYVMHHSKEVWGEDADVFRPQRWFEEGAAEREKMWIPWGLGYNSCPGQHLAKIETSKLAAMIIRDYDIRQVDEKQEWQYKAYFTVVPHSWPVYVKHVAP
ncbi:cytochrome P450 [Xylariomycetidae sp. FL2044]|nr:cytochrome P450 [Xylariomycetidae sp. FL2044]